MDYFKAYELVDKKTYDAVGEKAFALFDNRALETLDKLRATFGKTVVNSWHWGGYRTESGLRTPGMKHYRPYSQHSFGRAFDCIFERFDAEEVRDYIIANPERWEHIKGLEDNVSWLHFDTRNSDKLVRF